MKASGRPTETVMRKGVATLFVLTIVLVSAIWALSLVIPRDEPSPTLKWMGSTFIERAWAALIPVLLFSALFAMQRLRIRWLQSIPTGAWFLYFLWEVGISLSCGPISEGDCNIRIDLLIIYPVLLAATIFGVGVFLVEVIWKGTPYS